MREIKYGEPLCLVNCNVLMDQLCWTLPKKCGATFSNRIICVTVFADDLVLLNYSPVRLRRQIYRTVFLRQCGLALNVVKSHTVASFGYLRKTVVHVSVTFNIDGQPAQGLS